MKYLFHPLLLSLLMLLMSAINVDAQQRVDTDHNHNHDTYQQIDRAYEKGRLNLDQKVLFKFYAGNNPLKLPSEYQSENTTSIKCGTPAIVDFKRNRANLSQSTISEIESLGNPQINASQSYTSSSGRFEIHYETTGEHAVPSEDSDDDGTPDYVEQVAAAADSSYNYQVQNLGYSDPISQGQTYDIEIRNIAPIYGDARTSGNTTVIRIENDFAEDFPPNDHPEGDQIGAINATIAHEFKHAVQYAASEWSGETGYWLEMDATLMEEVVYDNVNDYYNYLDSDDSIFNNPQQSFYPGSYYHVTWALFFEEKYGSDFWVDVWEIIKQDPGNTTMVEALTQRLGDSEAFRRAFAESQLWHYASGPENSNPDYGFEESEHYPSPNITYQSVGDNPLAMPDTLDHLSATYFDVQPSPFPGAIEINSSKSTNSLTGFAVLGYFEDGSIEPIVLDDQQKSFTYNTNWEWDEISKLGIVAANASYQQNNQYGLALQSVDPPVTRIEQNYPNPFNNQTTIRFSLTERHHVQLEIYDALGRKVAILVDESRPEGIYKEQFNAKDYASGVYFYRLHIDDKITTKQMTLIK